MPWPGCCLAVVLGELLAVAVADESADASKETKRLLFYEAKHTMRKCVDLCTYVQHFPMIYILAQAGCAIMLMTVTGKWELLLMGLTK